MYKMTIRSSDFAWKQWHYQQIYAIHTLILGAVMENIEWFIYERKRQKNGRKNPQKKERNNELRPFFMIILEMTQLFFDLLIAKQRTSLFAIVSLNTIFLISNCTRLLNLIWLIFVIYFFCTNDDGYFIIFEPTKFRYRNFVAVNQ